MNSKPKAGVSHGVEPFFECSSKGDIRFSAFGARIRARGNRKIEDIYQAAKVFSDGSSNLDWRSAKGKAAVNQAEVSKLYGVLWDEYIAENPGLLEILKEATGLKDMFGQKGHACQATELWRIRCAALGVDPNAEVAKKEDVNLTLDLFSADEAPTPPAFRKFKASR